MASANDPTRPSIQRPRRRLYELPSEAETEQVAKEAKRTYRPMAPAKVEAAAEELLDAQEQMTEAGREDASTAVANQPQSHAHAVTDVRYVQALALVDEYRAKAMRTAWLPLPGLDWVAVTRLQVRMLRALADLYGMDMERDTARSVLAHCWEGHSAFTAASGFLGSSAKWVPILGSALGGGAVSLAAGASTQAAGRAFLDHVLEAGRGDDLDPQALRDLFVVHYKAANEAD